MAEFVFFTVTGKIQVLVTDADDEGIEPDLGPVTGLVTFTPVVSVVPSSTLSPVSIAILAPILARIEDDGVLRTLEGDDGVKLVANTAALGPLPELVYKVEFSKMKWDGKSQSLDPFHFLAPTSATSVDLATVPRV